MNNGAPVSNSLLWHDFETWGVSPSVDFPVQFAAIRTDLDLNIIEDHQPINWMCQIPHDYLPHPKACLITGITPSISLQRGMSEPSFAKKIHQQMMIKGTCAVGYNSLKFDEEVTRNLFYRNLYPVYDREYKNNNSRWDIIDLVRATYALRPQGIEWPIDTQGKPSFKLELLSQANDINHESAHDALSDVHATIAMAKLIKSLQPKLYDYYWNLRNKHAVDALLSKFQQTILVYVSGYISAQQGCTTLIMPICRHPEQANSVICVDLAHNIDMLVDEHADANMIQDALFTSKQTPPTEQSEHHQLQAPRLITIAINKCPFIAPLNTLEKSQAEKFGIDIELAKNRYGQLMSDSKLGDLCRKIFTRTNERLVPSNIDECLYTSEFPESADMLIMEKVREAQPEQLVLYQGAFVDDNLNRRLFRYRGRHFTSSLEENELIKWHQHLVNRFQEENKKACLSLSEYFLQLETLAAEYQNAPKQLQILKSLEQYGRYIANA